MALGVVTGRMSNDAYSAARPSLVYPYERAGRKIAAKFKLSCIR